MIVRTVGTQLSNFENSVKRKNGKDGHIDRQTKL